MVSLDDYQKNSLKKKNKCYAPTHNKLEERYIYTSMYKEKNALSVLHFTQNLKAKC